MLKPCAAFLPPLPLSLDSCCFKILIFASDGGQKQAIAYHAMTARVESQRDSKAGFHGGVQFLLCPFHATNLCTLTD